MKLNPTGMAFVATNYAVTPIPPLLLTTQRLFDASDALDAESTEVGRLPNARVIT